VAFKELLVLTVERKFPGEEPGCTVSYKKLFNQSFLKGREK